jgi:23S rRNA pseudouridine1911/1915/1917 synthase
MRLDRFLSRRFLHWSRTTLAQGIRDGLVTDPDHKPHRASHTVRAGEVLLLWIPGLAATQEAPPFPAIVHEDDRVVIVDKPPGMMCHPAGDRYVYALVGLAKERWPGQEIDLVHRIDADTSGLVAITKDRGANAFLKEALRSEGSTKMYDALVRGIPANVEHLVDAPIGPAEGAVRIQMAVRPDGLPSRTLVRVLGSQESPVGPLSHVRCRIFTGRTHQIRVHMQHLGHPLLGDRLYGGRPTLFLDIQDQGLKSSYIREAGSPRHALHSAVLRLPHPSGGWIEVERSFPDDMARWWATPSVLPLDGLPEDDPA